MRRSTTHFFFLLVIAVLLRVIFLKIKPPHYDEGINGNFLAEIWQSGFYKYDPSNYHGPFHFYLLQFFEQLLGPGIQSFRIATGLGSVLTAVVIWQHHRFIGPAAKLAAWIWVVSAGAVFYSRYAIHEAWFVFSQCLFCYGFLLYRQTNSRKSAALMAGSLVLAVSLKETFFIYFGTFLIAYYLASHFWPWFCQKFSDQLPRAFTAIEESADSLVQDRQQEGPQSAVQTHSVLDQSGERKEFWSAPIKRNEFLIVILLAVLSWAALFSGFGAHPQGISDFFQAFHFWVKTGVDQSGHAKPFWYWFSLLSEYEWPCLLALCLTPLSVLTGSFYTRLFSLLGFGTWLAYSFIPYKTTWCVLNMIWPLALAGAGLVYQLPVALVKLKGQVAFAPQFPWRGLMILLTLLSLGPSFRVNFVSPAEPKERYAYVQTRSDIAKLFQVVDTSLVNRPSVRDLNWVIGIADSWPLAWMLHRYNSVRYARVDKQQFYPEGIDVADILLIDKIDKEKVEELLKGRFQILEVAFRDSYEPVLLYVRAGLLEGLPGQNLGLRSFNE